MDTQSDTAIASSLTSSRLTVFQTQNLSVVRLNFQNLLHAAQRMNSAGKKIDVC